MFKNYFKTALRNLWRFKGFSFINILGLSIAITGCLLIALFVNDENQYDRFVPSADRIYRVYNQRTDNIGTTHLAPVPPMFATYLQQQYPETEATLRILMANGKMLFESGTKKMYEEKWLISDPTFFSFFPLNAVSGSLNGALNDPHSIVISSSLAVKYFGNINAAGKSILIDKTSYNIAAVTSALPEHFHLDFDFIMPMESAGIPKERMQSWQWQQFFTYIKLKPGATVAGLQDKFQKAVIRDVQPLMRQGGSVYLPFFQPLENIHLYSSDFVYDNAKRGNITYVRGLSIIAVFVLLIACFNFINLATARSVRRAREIGVRKVIGAERKQLVVQFTGESMLMSLIAVIISVAATLFILPALNQFTEKHISIRQFLAPFPVLGLVLFGAFIGIVAGIYPALVLSAFKPVKVLKGVITNAGKGGNLLRRVLVIVQFSLSALLIICTLIVYKQLQFLQKKDLGFTKEQVLYFNVQGTVSKDPEAFKNAISQSPGVIAATAGYGLPGDQFAGDNIIVTTAEGDKTFPANQFMVDEDYIKTLGLHLLAGRDFSKQFSTDRDEAFIINETAVRELGFKTPQNAIGKKLAWPKWENDSLHPNKTGRVIGVVKDFHVKSLHEKVATTVLQIYPPALYKMAVKVKTADLPATLAFIKNTWNKFSPDYPLDYNFLDDNFNRMYKAEDKLSSLLWIFTMMAVVVGCLGLFGLAAYTVEQARKEIGIRKVLGATESTIIAMLSSKFTKPVLIASLVAFPLGWLLMNKWLENFPYRVTIGWQVFVIATAGAVSIALATVAFQTIKAALANPVKSLRSE